MIDIILINIINKYPLLFKYIPYYFKTPSLCLIAVYHCGNNIKYVPRDIIIDNESIVYAAIADNPLCIKYINSEYLRYNDYKMAINLNPRTVYYAIENDAYIREFGVDIVNKDPNNIKLLKELDNDIIISALKKDGMLLGYIRNCYHGEITFEMCNIAINQNLCAMKYVPERFKKYFNILDRQCMTFMRKPNGDFGYDVDGKFVCF